jgi:hypothetical protein
MGGHGARMGDLRNAYKMFVVIRERKRLGKFTGIWNNIRMDIRKIGQEDVDWIHLLSR